MNKLVIVRHGESEWNSQGKWTGTTDINLDKKGLHEAALMGKTLRDIYFDQAYVTNLVRTVQTLDGILKASPTPDVPVTVAAALGERDYGIYTGKNKWQVKAKIGDEAFQLLRRSWDYPVPQGETMKQVYSRAVPYYVSNIVPQLVDGQTVLIVAHGNSIRSLVKYLESLNDDAIAEIEMIFGTALIYEVDSAGRMASKTVRAIDSPPPPA